MNALKQLLDVISNLSLLSILKLISDLLAAGFGILGLLTEFKKKNDSRGTGTSSKSKHGRRLLSFRPFQQITTAGKVALIGILLSLCVSASITIVESHKSHLEALTHQREVLDLATPLGKLQVDLTFSVNAKDADRAKFIEGFLKFNPVTNIKVFAGRLSCSAQSLGTRKPDLVLSSPPLLEKPELSGSATTHISRIFPLGIVSTTHKITSSEQIPGSTMIVNVLDLGKDDFTLIEAEFDAGEGKAYLVPNNAFSYFDNLDKPTERSTLHTRTYCYTFPE